MTKITKNLIHLLIGFILLTSTSVVIFNYQEYKELKDVFNEDNSNDDFIYLKTSPGLTFVVGVDTNPTHLDPVDAWELGSYYVIDQVCEGLFRHNLSDINLPIINCLAEEYWWEDSITLQIKLREGVLFHDNTAFNATAAKWSLDRLLYLTNCTGTLPPTTSRATTETLWRFPNGTAIINQVDAVNEYNITIHLNAPFGPLLTLLSFNGAYMLSPSSTPALDYIDLSTGDLVGTGPFEYDGYIPNTQVNFHAFQNYWQGKANISEMVFSIILDPTARNNAMLSHSIDFLCSPDRSLFSSFEADPEITVTHFTDIYGIPSTLYSYLGFNNDNINLTMRKAMSYAINYTYIIEEMQNGEVIRANSPISPGFGDAYNSSTYAASWNLAKARQILKDAGIPGTAGLTANNDTSGTVSDEWKTAEFATYSYTYDVPSTFRSNLFVLLEALFDQIGVTVVADGQVSFADYITKLILNPDAIDLFFLSWLPDYLDCFIMFDPLFNPIHSTSNLAQVNDTQLMNMVEDALDEIDDNARNDIYKDIQGYLATQLYPHAFGYHPKETYVYSANLTKYPHNALKRLYFYPCEWVTPVPPPPPPLHSIFIDDSDPNYNWSKTALENDWCSGSGTWNDPYVIKDIEIDGGFTYSGIEVYNSSVYFRIENCSIYNVLDGIHLSDVDNSLIYNNSISDGLGIGIFLEHSDNHTISYNNLLNITSGYGGYAIILMYSNHSKIINNSVISSIGGIASAFNFDVFISDNDIINNSMVGIATGLSSFTTITQNNVINNTGGIFLQDSNETTVNVNLVSENAIAGIYLAGIWTGCHNNNIFLNQIYDNGIVGLALDNYSSQNTIYRNEFIGNAINAQDNGTLNVWDYDGSGNSWDDYVGVDADDNGIGDTPYLIDGEAGSMDNYPIFDDGPDLDLIPPIIIINEPDNGDEFTTTPPIYDIEITETNLDSIWYTMDNGVNNVTISLYVGTLDNSLWNALPYGIVTITFYANDTAGNIGDATVLVYKNQPTTEEPGIPGPNPILILAIVFIGIIGLTWQRKQNLK